MVENLTAIHHVADIKIWYRASTPGHVDVSSNCYVAQSPVSKAQLTRRSVKIFRNPCQ